MQTLHTPKRLNKLINDAEIFEEYRELRRNESNAKMAIYEHLRAKYRPATKSIASIYLILQRTAGWYTPEKAEELKAQRARCEKVHYVPSIL